MTHVYVLSLNVVWEFTGHFSGWVLHWTLNTIAEYIYRRNNRKHWIGVLALRIGCHSWSLEVLGPEVVLSEADEVVHLADVRDLSLLWNVLVLSLLLFVVEQRQGTTRLATVSWRLWALVLDASADRVCDESVADHLGVGVLNDWRYFWPSERLALRGARVSVRLESLVYLAGVADRLELCPCRRIYVLILMSAEILNRRVVQRGLRCLVRRHLNKVHVRCIVVQVPARGVSMVD